MARPDVAMLDMNLRGELVTPVAARPRSLNIPFVLGFAYNVPGSRAMTSPCPRKAPHEADDDANRNM